MRGGMGRAVLRGRRRRHTSSPTATTSSIGRTYDTAKSSTASWCGGVSGRACARTARRRGYGTCGIMLSRLLPAKNGVPGFYTDASRCPPNVLMLGADRCRTPSSDAPVPCSSLSCLPAAVRLPEAPRRTRQLLTNMTHVQLEYRLHAPHDSKFMEAAQVSRQGSLIRPTTTSVASRMSKLQVRSALDHRRSVPRPTATHPRGSRPSRLRTQWWRPPRP